MRQAYAWGIVVAVVAASRASAGPATRAEIPFRAAVEDAVTSLPPLIREPALKFLDSGDPDFLSQVGRAADLVLENRGRQEDLTASAPALGMVLDHIDEPGADVSAKLNVALGMHALTQQLAPYLAKHPSEGAKFNEADNAAMHRLPSAHQTWVRNRLDQLVRSFRSGVLVEPDAAELAAVAAAEPSSQAAPPAAAKLAPAERRADPSVPAAGTVPPDAQPLEELARAHPQAAGEFVRMAQALRVTLPARFVWLDKPEDAARSGHFDADTLVVLGPGFRNDTVFGSAGPIFAWNATIAGDIASGGALLLSGGAVHGDSHLRGAGVVTSGVGDMEDAFVNGTRARRPIDMDFVRAKIKAVKG